MSIERSPLEQLIEIPASTPAKIAEFIEATYQDQVASIIPDTEHVVAKPLLGEHGHAQTLFNRFSDEAKRLSHGYSAVTIKVFPSPPSFFDRQILKEIEGNAIVFDDELGGFNIEIRHTEGRGVVAFYLLDDQESEDRGAAAGIIMMRSGMPMAFASFIEQGKLISHRLKATEASQIVLSSIAKILSNGEGLEETLEDLPA